MNGKGKGKWSTFPNLGKPVTIGKRLIGRGGAPLQRRYWGIISVITVEAAGETTNGGGRNGDSKGGEWSAGVIVAVVK